MKKIPTKSKSLLLLFTLVISLVTAIFPAFTTNAASDLPDPSVKGSLTVHKLSRASSSNLPGDGLELADPSVHGKPLAGAGFTLYKVNAGYKMTDQTTVAEAKANATVVGSEQITATDGITKFDNLEIGYYVLSETTTPAGYAGAVDSIITLPIGITETGTGWNYDLHVYPKNVKDDEISKEVTTTSPQYTVGDVVGWQFQAKVEYDLYTDTPAEAFGSFKVTDPLDKRLDFGQTTSVRALGGVAGPIVLAATDYTEVYNAATNTVTWELTQAGLKKVDQEAAKEIEISFNTVINNKAISGTPAGTPSISNGGELDIKDNNGTDGKNAEVDDKEKPSVDLAGVVINKVDSKDDTIALAGAKFKIATSLANAKAGTYIQDAAGADIEVVTGDNIDTATIEKGYGMFTGLALNASGDTEFYLVEVEAPTGYVKRQSVILATIPAGDKKVTIKVLNQKIGDPAIDEENPTFLLPNTGGIGSLIFWISGLALIAVGAFLLFFLKRKKEDDEEQVVAH
ncbi:SpaH/EbpB family LPXTG-anchored major pilin [Pseudolactococcus yaeyamensis]